VIITSLEFPNRKYHQVQVPKKSYKHKIRCCKVLWLVVSPIVYHIQTIIRPCKRNPLATSFPTCNPTSSKSFKKHEKHKKTNITNVSMSITCKLLPSLTTLLQPHFQSFTFLQHISNPMERCLPSCKPFSNNTKVSLT